MPLQKRRAAAVGKWHSACPEVRLYRSKVDGEKTLPSAGRLCNPCLRASRRPHGRGKTVTVAKGWGLVTNKRGERECDAKRQIAFLALIQIASTTASKKHENIRKSRKKERIRECLSGGNSGMIMGFALNAERDHLNPARKCALCVRRNGQSTKRKNLAGKA